MFEASENLPAFEIEHVVGLAAGYTNDVAPELDGLVEVNSVLNLKFGIDLLYLIVLRVTIVYLHSVHASRQVRVLFLQSVEKVLQTPEKKNFMLALLRIGKG